MYNLRRPKSVEFDGSNFNCQYVLTSIETDDTDDLGYTETIKEPIAMAEYVSRLATGSSTYAFQIDNVIEDEPSSWKQRFNEL